MFPYTGEEITAKVAKAAAFYWKTRREQARKQKKSGAQDAGTRGQVTGGRHLDGFAKLVQEIGVKAGCSKEDIYFNTSIPLPGYYRPQKNWDVIFLHEGKLLAAIELKSQSGSFGNNFNNRSEEVVGVSRDFWTAYREKAFGVGEAPWLGYFFFLEDSEASAHPVALTKSPLPPFPIFNGTSYQKRYEILCERLMLERDYTSTALVFSSKNGTGIRDGGPNVTAYAFFKSLYLHLASRIQA